MLKVVLKKSENLGKSQKITFFQQKKKQKKEEEEDAIILVSPIEEISLRPELSSPAHFRIQGGSRERHRAGAGRFFSFPFNFLFNIYEKFFWYQFKIFFTKIWT